METAKRLTTTVLAVAMMACGESTDPESSSMAGHGFKASVEQGGPSILERAPRSSQPQTVAPELRHAHVHADLHAAGALQSSSVRACNDRDAELRVPFEPDSRDAGEVEDSPLVYDDKRSDGSAFIRLSLPAGSLYKWPDGTPFADRECVEISATVHPHYLMVEWEPAGLRFNPLIPARLAMSYRGAIADLDRDGDVDRDDEFIRVRRLGVWRLPHHGESWSRLPAVHFVEKMRFEVDLHGFSHYAIAH